MNGARADAGFHGLTHTEELANGGAGARANRAFGDGPGGSRGGGGFAHFAGRANVGFADAEVIENRGRHDRHAGEAGGEADAFLFQKTADAGGRLEPEGAAAGQEDGVHDRRNVPRAHGFEFLGAAGAALDRGAGDGAALAQNGGAAGECVEIGNMTHADAVDVGKPVGWHM